MLRAWAAVAAVVGGGFVVACSSSGSSGGGNASQGTSSSSGGGASSSSGSAGNTDDASTSSGAVGAPALPEGTLLYLRAGTGDQDLLVARDLASGSERVITDLTGDGSKGWEIRGYDLSPDRRRVAIASLYGPTKEDNATGIATRAIWTLATDGSDFRRLTPTFPNNGGGKSGFNIDVGNPIWSADGANILYDFGNYWYESSKLQGGSTPWYVASAGNTLPSSWPVPLGCSVIHPSLNPATGEVLAIHSVCVPGSGEDGIYLYPTEGGSSPKLLVKSAHVTGNVDVFLQKASWLGDGSGFLFLGGSEETGWSVGVHAYDVTKGTVSPIISPPADSGIWSVAITPDGSKIVYCLYDNNTSKTDLHLFDVTASPPTDTAITSDGKSCYPSF